MQSNTDGSGNIALGFNTLLSSVHDNNHIAIGNLCMGTVDGASTPNIAIGAHAAYQITSGGGNIWIGENTGTGGGLTTGSHCIMLKRHKFPSNTNDYQLDIGNTIYGIGVNNAINNVIAFGQIGINVQVPTSYFDIVAGTTGVAQLRLHAGATPSAPNDGEIWYDGVHLKMRANGSTQIII